MYLSGSTFFFIGKHFLIIFSHQDIAYLREGSILQISI